MRHFFRTTIAPFCGILSALALSAPALGSSSQITNALEAADRLLIAQAKDQADSIREALARTFSEISSSRTTKERTEHLRLARRLARAYAYAWNDQFHVRQVTRFESATLAQQRARVFADSLRKAGNEAMGSAGIPSAMKLWLEGLLRAKSLGDPAAIAPAMLSVGAGFYRMTELDSAGNYLARAEALAVRIGDYRTAGNALGILASIKKDKGASSEAAALYRRASTVRGRSGDTRGIAADENNLGLIAQQNADFSEAMAHFARALALNRSDNRPGLVALNLGNMAGISTVTGDYPRAESLYREALQLNRQSGNRAETGFTQHGLGKLYMSRGDYRQAEDALQEALRIHTASGAMVEAVAVRADLAAVLNAAGNPESARVVLQQATYTANRLGAPPAIQGSLAMARGDLALQFGTFSEADLEYSRAIRLYGSARDSSGLAHGLSGRALLLHWRDDDIAALSLLRETARIQIASGDRRSAAITSLLIADVQMGREEFAASRHTLISARETLRLLGDVVGETATLAALGDLSLREGSVRNADASYRAGLKRLGAREASEVRWRLHMGLAEVLRRAGSLAAAAVELRTAIASAEKISAGLNFGERRAGFLADRLSAYTELALVEQARGKIGEAFLASEQMRSRQMRDMLARGRVPGTGRSSALEQDLRRKIALLTERLETRSLHASRVRDPALTLRAANATREELDRTQKAYAKLLGRIRESEPGYAALVSGSTSSWTDVASRLKTDEILLEYLVTDSATTVFVVTRDTVAAVDLHVNRQNLADLVEFSRKTVDRRDNARGAELWRIPLRRLYLTLIQPVAERGYLRGKRTLLIAPHGELHFLSFAALIAPGLPTRFLINQYQVAYTPSASVWVQLEDRPLRTQPAGIIALAPSVDRLPGSRREVLAISRIYGKKAVARYGVSATSRALHAALGNTGTVHLATFGILNKHNPLFSFIELAPAGGDDGRLEVNEVFGLPLSGQLVILSACQTALGSGALADVPPGDDWVGLVQAFLQAGARTVIASLWPVEDRATGKLMEEFHIRRAEGVPPVTALAEAQRTLIRNPATAGPLYWAGFTVSGKSE